MLNYTKTVIGFWSEVLLSAPQPTLHFQPADFEFDYAGVKYKITGRELTDSIFLLTKLGSFLDGLGQVTYEVATFKHMETYLDSLDDQKFVMMTIFAGKKTDQKALVTGLKKLLVDYRGAEGVILMRSTLIKGALYKQVETV